MKRILQRCAVGAWLLVLLLLSVSQTTQAQTTQAQTSPAEDNRPLIDQPAFDLIELQPEAGGESVKVLPLPFPDRIVPADPPPTGKLRVVLMRFPEREYEVQWKHIARIALYEQQIYDETLQKIAEKDFIGAFQNLSYLLQNYPNLPRLEELRKEFLLKSAADRFQAGEYRQTLSALEELHATAPGYQTQTVMRVLSQVADRLIDSYQQQGDLASVKALLNRLRQTYGVSLPVVVRWDQQFESLAEAKRKQALEFLEQKDYRRAGRAAAELLRAAPDSPEAAQIIEEIHTQYPMVRVGVMQSSRQLDPTSLVDWSARRTGKLVERSLFQFVETGAEGGRYGFTLGTYRLSDDRQQLTLSIDPSLSSQFASPHSPSLGTFELAQLLQQRATPQTNHYDPAWAASFKSVAIPTANQLVVQLKRPNVLPQALLQWRLTTQAPSDQAPSDQARSGQQVDEQPAESQPLLPGDYQLNEGQPNETVFSLRPDLPRSGQPLEVTEVFYSNAQQAVNDLLRGSIEVLDQLYPADAKRLASQPGVRVGSYALPTTHMLVPVSEHVYLANAKFRRALMVGTDRQSVLTREILGGDDPADGRLISGPFPMGRGADDPLAYAYNNSVPPIPTNPDLAKLLLAMSRNEVAESAKRNGEATPALETLIVGCPNYSLARVAVEALIEQWSAIGIEAEMLMFDSEESSTKPVDLVYTAATIWEPATDVQRLLGPGGIASTDNPFIVQALETLRVARNWREVRSALQDLHQLIDYHLPVLPLWQITDRFAVLNSLEGWHDKPLSLYQDISAWRFQAGP
ncbi:MAG: hypothetical protein IT422_12520 [Pirellulaceae bacterium]|nr:hypothetical protein [Pirellulaceae bacterium]